MRQVLVLDGDDAIRESLRLLLEETGYAVTEAADDTTALTVLADSAERVIVLFDLVALSPTGMHFLTQVARLPRHSAYSRHAYICMTTSPKLSGETHALLEHLPAPVVTKPFDVDALLSMVEQGYERRGTSVPIDHQQTDND